MNGKTHGATNSVALMNRKESHKTLVAEIGAAETAAGRVEGGISEHHPNTAFKTALDVDHDGLTAKEVVGKVRQRLGGRIVLALDVLVVVELDKVGVGQQRLERPVLAHCWRRLLPMHQKRRQHTEFYTINGRSRIELLHHQRSQQVHRNSFN